MKRVASTIALGALVAACAAEKRQANAPASPAADTAKQEAAPSTPPAGYGQPQPAQQPGYAPPPPPAPGPESAATGSTQARPAPSMALQQASSDIDSAQRQLDVAGGNCQTACRALGSMDRAAGKVCTLTRDDTSQDRCEDAKRRLLGARDRVRSTCGGCPDNQPAVTRDAPIPSMR